MPESAETDRLRLTVGLALGPMAFGVILLVPLPDMPPAAHRLLALLVWVVVYWVTEALPLPVTALLGATLAVVLGIGPPRAVFAPFADPIIFLFLGAFLIARAMSMHGLDQRFAAGVLSRPWIRGSPWRLLIVTGGVAFLLSMWISNTAATAMLLPIVVGMVRAGEAAAPQVVTRSYATGLLLMVAYAASIGGIATPIGTPPNLIGIGLVAQAGGPRVTFVAWMRFALPIALVALASLVVILGLLHRPGPGRIPVAARDAWHPAPWSAGEVNVLAVFSLAVALWIVPGLLVTAVEPGSRLLALYRTRYDEGLVALGCGILLFALPVDWKRRIFTLRWEDATEIDWGTILLMGGGLALGRLLLTTGLSRSMGEGITAFLGMRDVWFLTAVAAAMATAMSEAASNTASASVIVPVVLGVATGAHVDIVPPALAATLGASYGFMLPVSTPPNAIVYGSGLIPITRMVRAGALIDAVGFLLIVGGLRLFAGHLGGQP